MTSRSHLHVVTSWLNDLNDLTAGDKPLADSKRKIAALASALFDDFPPGAFTRQSLLVVSRAYTFFPSYSEIFKVLSPWWKDHRPAPIAIAQTDRSIAEKQAVRDRENAESWARTPQEIRAKITEIRNGFMPDLLGSYYAAAIRIHRPHLLGLLPPEWLKERSEPPERAALRVAAADIHADVKRGPPS
jgi:hypothetical protein